MYNRADGARNAAYWRDLTARDPNAFTDDQIDLLVFGFLCAQVSVGDDKPRGFPGIYQADVMNRRGTIALGRGYVHGGTQPLILF